MENNGASNKPAVQGGTTSKTDWKQWATLAVIIAIIAAGGYFLVNGTAKAPSETESDTVALESETAANANGPAPSFVWQFAPAGGNGTTGAPSTKVTLSVDGEAKDVGTFTGPCSVIGVTDAWTLQPNELTGVICSWDGNGDELGVFFDAGTYVLKKGVLTEGTDTAPSTRGGYETLYTL